MVLVDFTEIGHYEVPAEYKLQDQQPLQITGRSDPVIETLPLRYFNATKESLSLDVQTNSETPTPSDENANSETWHEFMRNIYTTSKNWLNQQENKGLKLTLIVLLGCILAMFWYLNAQFKEFQQLSQVLLLFQFQISFSSPISSGRKSNTFFVCSKVRGKIAAPVIIMDHDQTH